MILADNGSPAGPLACHQQFQCSILPRISSVYPCISFSPILKMRVFMIRRHIQIPLWIVAVAAVVIFGLGAIAGTNRQHNAGRDLTLLRFALPSGIDSYEAEMTGMTV